MGGTSPPYVNRDSLDSLDCLPFYGSIDWLTISWCPVDDRTFGSIYHGRQMSPHQPTLPLDIYIYNYYFIIFIYLLECYVIIFICMYVEEWYGTLL